jgi:hypothetical protein
LYTPIYYELNTNLVSDSSWSRWAVELKELTDKYPDVAARVPLASDFKDFDPSTGYNLNYYQPWVIEKANQLIGYKESIVNEVKTRFNIE